MVSRFACSLAEDDACFWDIPCRVVGTLRLQDFDLGVASDWDWKSGEHRLFLFG